MDCTLWSAASAGQDKTWLISGSHILHEHKKISIRICAGEVLTGTGSICDSNCNSYSGKTYENISRLAVLDKRRRMRQEWNDVAYLETIPFLARLMPLGSVIYRVQSEDRVLAIQSRGSDLIFLPVWFGCSQHTLAHVMMHVLTGVYLRIACWSEDNISAKQYPGFNLRLWYSRYD